MSLHDTQMEALSKKDYSSLVIIRYLESCFLVVEMLGEAHMLVNSKGESKKYRHAWQIKKWLKESFEIDSDTIKFEVRKI